jgi:EAL domain-containing protein (putative c-di-GMP-specific phosphodiesterase class I)
MLLLIQEHVSFGLNNNVMIARVEHDLLAVLLQDITPSESIAFEYVTKKIQHFRRKLKDHISIDSQKFFLTFKAGIRLFKPSDFCDPRASENAKALIKQTEFTMDLVTKESEVPYLFFTDELLFQYQRRISIENELKLALTNNEFYLVYQPIFDNDNNIMGAEALLRWENKLLGNVSPAEFIPIAEQSGLVIDIGNLVAEQVCKALNSQLQDIKYISINVSCIQLKDSMYSDKLEYLLAKYPKSRGRLWIEITESVAMTYLKRTQLLMNELRAKGIRFMLDDFGTGHSSLAYLNELPLSTVKVDRCFISGVTKCKKKQAIVESIRKLSESFSLNCVAEGIENESDYTFLKTIGVDSFQGFLISKPISQDELIKTLSI